MSTQFEQCEGLKIAVNFIKSVAQQERELKHILPAGRLLNISPNLSKADQHMFISEAFMPHLTLKRVGWSLGRDMCWKEGGAAALEGT